MSDSYFELMPAQTRPLRSCNTTPDRNHTRLTALGCALGSIVAVWLIVAALAVTAVIVWAAASLLITAVQVVQ